jgi:hypothetical protein
MTLWIYGYQPIAFLSIAEAHDMCMKQQDFRTIPGYVTSTSGKLSSRGLSQSTLMFTPALPRPGNDLSPSSHACLRPILLYLVSHLCITAISGIFASNKIIQLGAFYTSLLGPGI